MTTLQNVTTSYSIILDLNMPHTDIKFDNNQGFTLVLTQKTGNNTVTWPNNIKWQFGLLPNLSQKKGTTDLLYFMTFDQGQTWLGSYVSGGYR